MEQINNDQTIKESSAVLGYQVQTIPPLDTSKISLVANVNPKDYRRCNIVRRSSAINSTGGTIYTTPTDKDFFLNSVALSVIKDVTSTSILSNITCIIDGATNQILSIPGISLTVQNQSLSISFPIPIKIDRGSAIGVSNSTNVANISTNAMITGYTVD